MTAKWCCRRAGSGLRGDVRHGRDHSTRGAVWHCRKMALKVITDRQMLPAGGALLRWPLSLQALWGLLRHRLRSGSLHPFRLPARGMPAPRWSEYPPPVIRYEINAPIHIVAQPGRSAQDIAREWLYVSLTSRGRRRARNKTHPAISAIRGYGHDDGTGFICIYAAHCPLSGTAVSAQLATRRQQPGVEPPSVNAVLGEDNDSLTLSEGSAAGSDRRQTLSLLALEQMSFELEQAWPLIEGSGTIYGMFVIIESLSQTKKEFCQQCRGHVRFTITLKRVDESLTTCSGTGDQLSGLRDSWHLLGD